MIDRNSCPRELGDVCELLHVAELGTRELRADYLDRCERYEGRARADALRDLVAETWRAWRTAGTPLPCRCEAAAAAVAGSPGSERPGGGSSLDLANEGSLRREGVVVSEGAA